MSLANVFPEEFNWPLSHKDYYPKGAKTMSDNTNTQITEQAIEDAGKQLYDMAEELKTNVNYEGLFDHLSHVQLIDAIYQEATNG